MHQNKYFCQDPSLKPFSADQKIEGNNHYGNPLLREVDHELKRLKQQFNRVSGLSSGISNSYNLRSANLLMTANYNPASISPKSLRIERVEKTKNYDYQTDNLQQTTSSSTSRTGNHHHQIKKYIQIEALNQPPQGLTTYGYLANTNNIYNIQKSEKEDFSNQGSISNISQFYKEQFNTQSYAASNKQNQLCQKTECKSSSETSRTSIAQVYNNGSLNTPTQASQVIRVLIPKSETIRINSPPKINSCPFQIARVQEKTKMIPEMHSNKKQRDLAKEYQQETAKIKQQREKYLLERKQRQEKDTSVSKVQAENYITNINLKSKKISEVENKFSNLQYQYEMRQVENKKLKTEIKDLKNEHKIQTQNLNSMIYNLKKEIDIMARDRDSKNKDLNNKINKINYSYEEVIVTNNILNREIQILKAQILKKQTTKEMNQSVFDNFRQKMNEKTYRINQLEKQLLTISQQKTQLKKRVDQLLLQEKQFKKRIYTQKSHTQHQIFNEVLKQNLEQNQSYKSNLAVKQQQILMLQELNRLLKGENDRMKNQIQIQRLKRMTELKNIQTNLDIQIQVKQNEIISLNHVVTSLEQKLKFIVQQDRKKDDFMVSYLKGRAGSFDQKQSVDNFFKQFQVLAVNNNISQCLKREQKQIQRLKDEVQKLYRQRR